MAEAQLESQPPTSKCFKHSAKWQPRVQQIINVLRNGLIPQQYVGKFNSLLCTCETAKITMAQHWSEVSDDKLASAVTFIDEYIDSNRTNKATEVTVTLFKKVMEWLRSAGEICAEEPHSAPQHSCCSALRLLYLLQKVIQNEYDIFESKSSAAEYCKTEQQYTFEVTNCSPSRLGHIIGTLGQNILKFQKKHQCRVEFYKKNDNVKAIITKNVADVKRLEEIATQLKVYCQKYVREDMQQLENEITQPQNSTTVITIADTEIDNLAAHLPKNSSIGCTQDSLNTNLVPDQAVENPGRTETNTSGTSIQSSNNTVEYMVMEVSSAADQCCPTLCIVHDRRWVSTYQYMLNQLYVRINLLKMDGRRFSRHVCTCDVPKPDAFHYFKSEEDMKNKFEITEKSISNWPKETHVIMQPVLMQLRGYDNSETWHSLFKLVFYYNAVMQKHLNYLEDNVRLPGQNLSHAPRQEKHAIPANATYIRVSSKRKRAETPHVGGISAGAPLAFMHRFGQLENSSSSSSILESESRLITQPVQMEPEGDKRMRLKKKLTAGERLPECYFHGKKKSLFQCVVNNLLKNSGLPLTLQVPFSMAICCCAETVKFEDFYKSEADALLDCIDLKNKFNAWKAVDKNAVKSVISHLEQLVSKQGQPLTNDFAFLKFVYHCNQVFKNQRPYEDFGEQIKQQQSH